MKLPTTTTATERRELRGGFTLLELLIVVTVIILLMGLLVGIGLSIKEKAKESATSARMEAVLSALNQYSSEGSVALVLQENLNLGGVPQFATVQSIDSACTGGPTMQPPPFRYYWNWNGWQIENLDSVSWQTNSGGGGNIYGAELPAAWSRFSKLVFDVMPLNPSAVAGTSDWLTQWPTQWPQSDWDQATPGVNPPMLRFPWGKPGLRVDGSVCDPETPAGVPSTNPQNIAESQSSGGAVYPASLTYPLANSWATMGAPLSGTPFTTWSSNDSTQTDYVTISAAVRSDSTAVPAASLSANLPLPFDLGYCSPLQTIAFLQAANILAPGAQGGSDYRTNRSAGAPWNDAWGNPLVVVYAIYQPERYFRNFDQYNRRDLFLRNSVTAYQFDRAIYIAVAAPGKQLYAGVPTQWGSSPTDSSQDAATLRQFWLQIRDVCWRSQLDRGLLAQSAVEGHLGQQQERLQVPADGAYGDQVNNDTQVIRGFTVIELLTVIVIIALLMGLLFTALNMMTRQRKRVDTINIMRQVTVGVTDYLQTYPLLGNMNDSSDFVDSPWTFLGRNPLAAGQVPYTGDMLQKNLAQGTVSGGVFSAGTQTNADQIIDGFTVADHSNHFIWYIIDNNNSGRFYTDKVYLRSTAGTIENPNDDIIMRLTVADGLWTTITYAQSLLDTPAPAAPGW